MVATEGSSADGIFEAEAESSPAPGAIRPGGVRFLEGSYERGLRLYHCEFVPERLGEPGAAALVVLMHGYGEHCRRYDDFARYLARRGHVVCAMDARGHGRSQGQRGYVHAYSDYVDDFVAFVARMQDRHRRLSPPAALPLVVVGHSNGGLIAVRAIQAGLLDARGLMLTSPLLGLRAHRKAVSDGVARALSALLPRLPVPNGIRSEHLTHDPVLREAHRRDRWVHGMATSRWYWTMTLATRAALADAERVSLPLLIAQAELDPIIDPGIVAEFHARVGSADKRLIVRPGEYHEVLNETARHELFAISSDWIERVVAG